MNLVGPLEADKSTEAGFSLHLKAFKGFSASLLSQIIITWKQFIFSFSFPLICVISHTHLKRFISLPYSGFLRNHFLFLSVAGGYVLVKKKIVENSHCLLQITCFYAMGEALILMALDQKLLITFLASVC